MACAAAMWLGLLLGLSAESGLSQDVQTSILDLEKVLHAESDLATIMTQYVKWERQRLVRLEQISEDFRSHSEESLRDPAKSLGNLVSVFLTMKRFTNDWSAILDNHINNVYSRELTERMVNISEMFPKNEDLQGAAAALLRLQDTYALEAAAMARGEIQGVHTNQKLRPEDCFLLGRLAYNQEDYYHSVLWMEHAYSEAKSNNDVRIDMNELFDYLNFAHFKSGNAARGLELVDEWLKISPENERALNNQKYYRQILEEEAEMQAETCEQGETGCPDPEEHHAADRHVQRPRNDWTDRTSFKNYEALCRGEDTHPKRPGKHQLHCSNKHYHPFFTIIPLKEEVLNFQPRIVIVHDLVTKRETTQVTEVATPYLHRSGVFRKKEDADTTGAAFTAFRTSKTSWLKDGLDRVIQKVSARTAAAVNLSLETVEDMQVVNYGIGGHYEPHYDFNRGGMEVNSFDDGAGNRIATVICYLADVEAGGATVFPDLGVRVPPERGACAVWYNLLRNGEGDYRTLHAGCPVLTGTKWIATKWFHEGGQEFLRPCATDPSV